MGVNPTLNAGETIQERDAKSDCLFVEGVRRSWTRRKEYVTMNGRTRKIPRQAYTAEFKDLAVKRVNDGLTAGAAARKLGWVEQT